MTLSELLKPEFLLPKEENDSDLVYDLGKTDKPTKKSPGQKSKGHHIGEFPGKCLVYCPKTKHAYAHIIQVPNKFALLCRGCGLDI